MKSMIHKRKATLYTILITLALGILPLSGVALPQHTDITKPTRERVQKDKKDDKKDDKKAVKKDEKKADVKPAVTKKEEPKKEDPKKEDPGTGKDPGTGEDPGKNTDPGTGTGKGTGTPGGSVITPVVDDEPCAGTDSIVYYAIYVIKILI